MTCRDYEPLIALYVEGDLNGREVERHLAECSDCRELLEDLKVSQAALKELLAVDAAFLSAVRSGVLAKIERRRLTAWPWIAALAALLIVAVLTVPRKPTVLRDHGGPTGGSAADQGVRPTISGNGKPGESKRRRRRTRESAPPLVVKMLTDDPDIVIIWLVDQPGD